MKFLKSTFKKVSTKLKTLWKTRRWLMIGVIVVLLIIGRMIFASANSQEQLTFVSPTRVNLTKTLEVSGLVDAKEKASMRFLEIGRAHV